MKTINFEYIGKHAYSVCEKPYPAKDFLPDWFKSHPPYAISEDNPNGKKIIVRNRFSNATAKKCTPMLDGMTAGYIVPLWADVQVTQNINGPSINWRVSQNVFEVHGNYSSDKIDPVEGFHKIIFKYITNFRIRTPNGYSVMVRTPAGHYDLPFYVLPAVIDSDKSALDSNLPCWVSKNFEGIVKKGTPIAQIIPFKRENWNHQFSIISEEQYEIEKDKYFESTISNNYIKNIWTRKTYR